MTHLPFGLQPDPRLPPGEDTMVSHGQPLPATETAAEGLEPVGDALRDAEIRLREIEKRLRNPADYDLEQTYALGKDCGRMADGIGALLQSLRSKPMGGETCATEGCGNAGTERFEAGGVGSNYCPSCRARIAAIAVETKPVAWVDPATIRVLQERKRWTTAILRPTAGENATMALYQSPQPSAVETKPVGEADQVDHLINFILDDDSPVSPEDQHLVDEFNAATESPTPCSFCGKVHVSQPLLDAPRVKALDLANVMRDAFLAGRGLKDGDKLSEADSIAWANYAPKDSSAYDRLYALLNSALQSDGEGT